MKKVDLHIHTIPTISDSSFVFSLEKLIEYVETLEIDGIAITNHNLFDEIQYSEIRANLNIHVFPGIEINLENGHMLLISDDVNIPDFTTKCKKIKNLVRTKQDYIALLDLKNIFVDLSRYILIPHYTKKPEIKESILFELKKFITAGEVTSIKKFVYCIKNPTSLVPVFFSDVRITDKLTSFPTRQTYIRVNEISFGGIKSCLLDKDKVSLSKNNRPDFFQALSDGVELSIRLNVILGERSSGKTFTLDRINRSFENVKYIKQFSLLEKNEEEDIRNFRESLNNSQSLFTQEYLREFKEVVDDVIGIDAEKNEKDVEKYIESLMSNATEMERADAFSNSIMFNEIEFQEHNLDNLKSLIDSVTVILENTEYKEIITQYISENQLKQLAVALMERYTNETHLNIRKQWINDLVSNIKKALQVRTATTPIKEIDLFKIAVEKEKLKKFVEITSLVKMEKEILRKDIQGFNIVANTKKYCGASELKSVSGKKLKFSEAYVIYDDPLAFLEELKSIDGLPEAEYYKYFINIQYKILNRHGYEVSGGERSEFNLLQEISDAQRFDMLLIDEPESSFDNLFLKNDVNKLIKDISKTIPVIVVTHNNTVGASIKPDYVVYTKKEITDDGAVYNIYTGLPSDKKLISIDNETISNYNIILNCLEAGKPAYIERGNAYEVLED